MNHELYTAPDGRGSEESGALLLGLQFGAGLHLFVAVGEKSGDLIAVGDGVRFQVGAEGFGRVALNWTASRALFSAISSLPSCEFATALKYKEPGKS
jgi:hypothetical protein